MNTTTRNIIIAATAAVLIVGIVIAVLLLLTGSSEADRINSELAQLNDSVSDAAEDEKDGKVTTGEYNHTSEPVIAEEEPDESNTTTDSEPTKADGEPYEDSDPSEPAEPAKPQTTPAQTTTATTTRPAVTVVTTTPAVTAPPSTLRTDLPVVTAEPTTAATTPAEPTIAVEYDDDGFPANPTVNQYFVDSSGQEYVYDSIFGWIKGNLGTPNMTEFPDFEVEGGDEQILW